MYNIDIKNIIITGFIVGIALFFIGAIISNVFPSSESDLLSYRASAITKLIGIGFLTCSMVVGGIVLKDIDKNQKILILVIGLILLIIYTVGSLSLQWDVDDSEALTDTEIYDERPTGYGMPGFELAIAIVAFAFILYLKRKSIL
jgi:hypothetical protein